MRVFGWMADRGGCGYYRIKQPLDALASELGWDVQYSTKLALADPIGGRRMSPAMAAAASAARAPLPPGELGWQARWPLRAKTQEFGRRLDTVAAVNAEFDRAARELAEQFDVIVGQMPGAQDGSTELWQTVCRYGARTGQLRTVYEIDDNVFKLHRGHWHRSHEKLSARADAMRRCIEVADAVTCTTPALAELITPWNPNVHVIPNMIDRAVLDIEPERGMPHGVLGRWPANRNGPAGDNVLIGWGGSATHALDWAECWPGLQRLLRDDPRAYLATMGTLKPMPMIRGIEHKHGHLAWTPDMCDNWAMYYRRVGYFQIGLAPLEANEFNESKSYVKALEYAALGIPIVASRSPAYEVFLADSGAGILVDKPHEWRSVIGNLVNDDELRDEASGAARFLAGQHTIQGKIHKWASVLAREGTS